MPSTITGGPTPDPVPDPDEWPELAYHLERLAHGDNDAKLVALEAIHHGLILHPGVDEREAVDLSLATYLNNRDSALGAKALELLSVFGMGSDCVRNHVLAALSIDAPLVEIEAVQTGLILVPRLGDLDIIDRVADLCFHEDRFVIMRAFSFLSKCQREHDTGGARYLANLMAPGTKLATRIEECRGSTDAIISNAADFLANPTENYEEDAVSKGVLEIRQRVLEGEAKFTRLTPDEIADLYAQIRTMGKPPEVFLAEFFRATTRVMCLGLPMMGDNLDKLAKALIELKKTAGLTHIGIPIDEKLGTMTLEFAKGTSASAVGLWGDTPEEDEISSYREFFRILYANFNLLFMGTSLLEEGELGLDTRATKIDQALNGSQNAKVLILDSEYSSARQSVHTDGSIHLSLAHELKERFGGRSVVSIISVNEDFFANHAFFRVNNFSDLIEQNYIGSSFGISTQNPPLAGLAWDLTPSITFGTYFDGMIFWKSGPDDEDFFRHERPTPRIHLPATPSGVPDLVEV